MLVKCMLMSEAMSGKSVSAGVVPIHSEQKSIYAVKCSDYGQGKGPQSQVCSNRPLGVFKSI